MRHSLLKRLAEVGEHIPLITLVAPAGYGKTTTLSQWAAASDQRFLYLRLGPAHNEDARLLDDLARAVNRHHHLDHAVRSALTDRDPYAVDVAVPQIVAAVHAVGEPVVIVLDDVHHLRRAQSLDAVLQLAQTVPTGCHVVLASQRPPRIRIGGMRGHGRCVEFAAADLAFSTSEAAVLAHQMGVELTDESVEELVRRTEGWPAGVHLAALSLRGATAPGPATVESVVSGERGLVADHLKKVALSQHSPETVDFLVRTSVLERLSAPLCDAVLRSTTSATQLTQIASSTLFVIPEDGRGEQYRYHRLFAQVLLGELRRRTPAQEPQLLSRAAAWCEAQGDYERAVTYALQAHDGIAAARLLTVHLQHLHAEGRIQAARRWLHALPDNVLRAYPPCALAQLWVWALTGDPTRARRCLWIAESSTFDGAMPDGSASYASALARARALLSPQGVDAMLRDAQRASELEPPGGPWYTMAQLLLGSAQLLTGDSDAATRSFELAAHLAGHEQEPAASYSLAQLSLIAAERGNWTTAAARMRESQAKVRSARLGSDIFSLLTYTAGARTALHHGHDQTALGQLNKALRLYGDPSPRAIPWLGAYSAMVLGHVLTDLGDLRAAQQKLGDATRYLTVLGDSGLLMTWHRILMQRLARARNLGSVTRAAGLTSAESRILRLLPTHLTLSDIGREFQLSTNTVKSQVGAIYRKLGVASRGQAVQRAFDLGLLEPGPSHAPGPAAGNWSRPPLNSRPRT
ncbi:MAG TPA: LuxR C-terminal-related transcriptional regulator [Kineosporiaceae bacterium]